MKKILSAIALTVSAAITASTAFAAAPVQHDQKVPPKHVVDKKPAPKHQAAPQPKKVVKHKADKKHEPAKKVQKQHAPSQHDHK
ncbi:hypothetical protein [Acinetobacter gerneri]|jgi:outer membrane biosynthesis protein TonB|uniref:Acid shock protein n=2 Tax=Acinetobacter gerneri TaxID=202952 RepID=N8ZM37_9GAMM|nr:hypothetical protein [Acinetobacter gerneri]ENV34809.1 hypothetical protein F960_01117 [Acinetobacter gerneri DSM 14967 = CIP 107464 = MTCC 9824]EPR85476.1 hypothetical protein L289_1245 [Acinetobacter gerneri DSM 14967 = CIP 107464 = MTCC 9824]MCH4244402.1 hypothetical protein [Acinetobacter gerneri]MDQ9010669.1 hypothetical protein [Acinetobacter gerneri]MDQ9014899.1 hypothetical protein [Acinetobacter gerneri]